MYLPNTSTMHARAYGDHGEFHDDSINAGQLAGIAICMVLILVGIVCFLFVLGRHCFTRHHVNLWPSWCCTCYPADALEKAQQSNELPSYREATDATQYHGAREVEIVQPPAKAHMSVLQQSRNEGDSDSRKCSISKQKKSMVLSTIFNSVNRQVTAPLA